MTENDTEIFERVRNAERPLDPEDIIEQLSSRSQGVSAPRQVLLRLLGSGDLVLDWTGKLRLGRQYK